MRRFRISKEEVRKQGITPGCKGCARALGNGTAVNHSDKCRQWWEDKLIKDADPRILRQAERMYTPQEEASSSSSSRTPQPTQESIPIKTDEDDNMDHDDEMDDGSSQAGIDDKDRMLMSLTPDRTVQQRIPRRGMT